MKKFIFLVIFCISFLQINVVKSNDNVAFIDLDFVIKNSILGKQVLNNINNLDKKNVESLKKKNKELKEKETELKNKKNVISQENFKKELKILKDKLNIYTNEKNIMVQNFNKFKKEELDKVFKKIGPIVSTYMEANSINIVFDTKNMFMGNSKSDITKQIIDEINKVYK
tara:strand:+ start:26 stop:535 length:510 start_codon:yes stop_codon:yes gene_type:complete